MQKFIAFGAAVVITLVTAATASADTVTINASNRGWVYEGGATNGASPTNGFITGNCFRNSCGGAGGEYRSWFQFEIPNLAGPITGAELVVDSQRIATNQQPTLTVDFTSAPSTFGFADLGTGTVYGSRVYSAADTLTQQVILLNAAAIGDISSAQGSILTTGQRVSAGAGFSQFFNDQFAFGNLGFPGTSQLRLTFIPEPSTALLLSLGLMALGARRSS